MSAPAAVPVLLVIRHMNMGGAQRQLAHLAAGLDPERYRPTVVCLHREEPLLADLRSRGIACDVIPVRRGFDPTVVPRLAALARRRRARILHSFLFAANAWGRMAALLGGVPVAIASERSDRPARRRREMAAERLLAPLTSAWVVNAEAVGRTLASLLPGIEDRVVCIPNGVDLAAFALDRDAARRDLRREIGAADDEAVVGLLGNLTPDKGHRVFLEAAARLGPLASRLRVVCIGEGEERAAITAQASAAGLGARLHLLGLRDDVPRLLIGLDLLVQASVREGMPNAVLEGMAAGLPIVATRVGGTAEALAEGACGVLVPAGDPGALSRALAGLLADPARAAALGAAARRRAGERYGLEAMVQATAALYDRLLAERTRARRGGAPAHCT